MKVYTSYFANKQPGIKKIGISLYPPKWFDGENITELAPSKDTFNLKDDYEAYKKSYINQLDVLGFDKIKDLIHRYSNSFTEDIALCCFESLKKFPGEWCHRTMLAEYLNTNYSTKITEVPNGSDVTDDIPFQEYDEVWSMTEEENQLKYNDLVHKACRLMYLGYPDSVIEGYLKTPAKLVTEIRNREYGTEISKDYNLEIPPNDSLKFVPAFVNPDIDLDEPTHTYNLLSDPEFKFTSGTTFIKPFFDKFDGPTITKELVTKGKRYHGMTAEQIIEHWDADGYNDEALELRLSKGIPRIVVARQTVKFAKKYGHREVPELLEEWNQTGIKGTAVHKELEDYILSLRQTPITMSKARGGQVWIDKMLDNPEEFDWYPEVILYSKKLGIAGTIDLLLIHRKTGIVYVFDWKTNKKIYLKSFNKKKGHQPATKNIDDCNYSHYSLQLSLYRFLLEREYNCVVEDLYIVHLTEDNEELKTKEGYELIKCSYMESTILAMLKTLGYSE